MPYPTEELISRTGELKKRGSETEPKKRRTERKPGVESLEERQDGRFQVGDWVKVGERVGRIETYYPESGSLIVGTRDFEDFGAGVNQAELLAKVESGEWIIDEGGNCGKVVDILPEQGILTVRDRNNKDQSVKIENIAEKLRFEQGDWVEMISNKKSGQVVAIFPYRAQAQVKFKDGREHLVNWEDLLFDLGRNLKEYLILQQKTEESFDEMIKYKKQTKKEEGRDFDFDRDGKYQDLKKQWQDLKNQLKKFEPSEELLKIEPAKVKIDDLSLPDSLLVKFIRQNNLGALDRLKREEYLEFLEETIKKETSGK